MDSFYVNQLVWAKVDGFPWWPGIVISTELDSVTVYFIGENSHATLKPSKVCAFEEKEPTGEDPWLLRSIRAAKKLQSPITIDQIKQANEKLERKQKIKKRQRKEESSEDNLESKIAELHRILDNKIKGQDTSSAKRSTQNVNTLLKTQKLLTAFAHRNLSKNIGQTKPTMKNLVKCFKKLVDLKVSQKLFMSCKIIKLVKLFKNEFEDSQEAEMKILVRIADKLIKRWEKIVLFSAADN
ncbi:unnamed protein product [Blepharisma stoltei]|uniref:PWWP domain-containing protein n=1 Tax=Blepharisma stoltei TaxID=1481888 RepID=A0AAU9JUE4_9CILI|nr:unnamed protein product [Blepharisma stoltei]